METRVCVCARAPVCVSVCVHTGRQTHVHIDIYLCVCSDGGIFRVSAFGRALQEETLDLPEDAPLPGGENLCPMPHTFVADEAFRLK